MKKTLIVFIAVNIFISCLSVPIGIPPDAAAPAAIWKQEDIQYKITAENAGEYGAFARYESYEYLKLKEDRRALAEMRSPDYGRIPAGGYIFILIRNITIGSANPKYYTYILRDADNNEIYRAQGRDKIADYNISQTGRADWYSIDSISLWSEPRFPLYLRIASQLDNAFSDFIIEKADG